MNLHFEVAGTPQPAGSKKAVPASRNWRDRPGVLWHVVDDNDKSAGWKNTVASTAKGAALRERLPLPVFADRPVEVTMVFTRARPQSHVTTRGALSAEGLRTPFPSGKPDVLKLARGVEDALTGVAWQDDARIVREVLVKQWGTQDGVEVFITEAGDDG